MGSLEDILKDLDEEKESSKVLSLLDSLKPFVRNSSVRDRVIELLLNCADRLVRIKATELLEELDSDDDKAVEALIKALLNDPDSFVRGFSAKALGKLGSVYAKEAIKRACEDPDGFVRHYANEALKIIEMKERLLSVIQKAKGG